MTREMRIANRIVAEMPQLLVRGNLLDGFKIEDMKDGTFCIHYGASRGWETVGSMAEVKAKVFPWLDGRAKEFARGMRDVEVLRRSLMRQG